MNQPKIELEDHFLLRLPPAEARLVRKLLHRKPKKVRKHLALSLDVDARAAVVRVGRHALRGTLFDLPRIVESTKTVDGVHLFKTADVCQILICRRVDDNKDGKENRNDGLVEDSAPRSTYRHPHGITPPMKNARRFRFRKASRNPEDPEEAADVEKEVTLLLRTDNEAVATRFEFVEETKPAAARPVWNPEISEMSIFGDTLSDMDSDKESSSSGTQRNDIMDFTR